MASISDRQKELAILQARVEEAVRLCERRGVSQFIGFLDETECAHARHWLRSASCRSVFYGGHEDAERCILCVCRDEEPEAYEYPLQAVSIHFREQRELSHRDFLGTLLSAGIKRDTIGDILIDKGIAVVFLRTEIVPFVQSEIRKIGGEGVSIDPYYDGPMPVAHTFADIHETVASARLDVIVKTLVRCSREQAAQLIVTGAVQVDHIPVESVSATVRAPAVLSVRGTGRFAVDQIGPETKKGRLNLAARKYI